MNDDPCLLSATELRGLIAARKLSPVEVVGAVLARAEALQSELNCFITLCGDEAMAQARAAERKMMAGEPLGLLHALARRRMVACRAVQREGLRRSLIAQTIQVAVRRLAKHPHGNALGDHLG